MVGTVPRIWTAKDGHLMTSTLDTRESRMSEVFGQLSMEIAFALPWTRIVVLLHFVIRIEWFCSAWISIGAEVDS
jgi:hypothetical protein